MNMAITFGCFEILPPTIKDIVKQDLIDAALASLDTPKLEKASKKDKRLITLLYTKQVGLDNKWAALKGYMLESPEKTDFYKDIARLLNSFLQKKNMSRYLPREEFKQKFEALSAEEAMKVKKTVIEAMFSDFNEASFLSTANDNTLSLIEQLKDIKKANEEKWLAVWAYFTNVCNRNEKLYEQILEIFSVLAPALKGKNFVRDINILGLTKIDGFFKNVYKEQLIKGILSANNIYFYSDYVSKNLIQILSDKKASLDIKWAELEDYMSLPTNKKRELYKEILKRFGWLTSIKTCRDYRARFFSDAVFEHDTGLAFFPVTLPLGAIRALTRDPLEQLEYERVLSQLIHFIENASEETKCEFIAKIERAYKGAKSLFFSSKESNELLSKLQSEDALESKCKDIIRYIFLRNEAGYYINNGKKMCCIIKENLMPHINQFELRQITSA